MAAVAREVDWLEPALVSCAKPEIPEVRADAGVEWSARSDDANRTYIAMANPDPEKPAKVACPIAGERDGRAYSWRWKRIRLGSAISSVR